MADKEVKLMKGNEVIAHAAIRYGCDGYFGYPITPQSEVMETLMELKPWETTGMVVLQAESEIASINMVYGGAATGKRVMTSSSSPGISLMSEGLSYLAGAELPCLIVNCQRGGPGLGTIQPSQGDYFQACKGGGHGDFHMIVLAPNSVQEMHDFVALGFDLAFKYRNPAMILADGAIGQMMEKVTLSPQRPRKTDEEIVRECGEWAATGKTPDRKRNIATSLELRSEEMEKINLRLQAKYRTLEENEVRYEAIGCDDADYVIVAFGSSARICSATVELAREEGLKVGLLRPITLYPFPAKPIAELAARGVKGFLSAELNAGQMVTDVRLAVNGKVPVEHYGRQGGIVFTPDEVLDALKTKIINKQ
ncbi:MAG: 3-methyl-2-oxobutanoate dehydrogenase subunit VorB [Alistipes sp.]|nr:3-methyl-2-oxobutanoate dehydrogenase subunit VorB [Alistipes sp.]